MGFAFSARAGPFGFHHPPAQTVLLRHVIYEKMISDLLMASNKPSCFPSEKHCRHGEPESTTLGTASVLGEKHGQMLN